MTSIIGSNLPGDITSVGPSSNTLWNHIKTPPQLENSTVIDLQHQLPTFGTKTRLSNNALDLNGDVSQIRDDSFPLKMEDGQIGVNPTDTAPILSKSKELQCQEMCEDEEVYDEEVDDTEDSKKGIPDHDFTAIINLANLADSMDVYSVMQAVEAKILDNFTSWDLIVRRARLFRLTNDEKYTVGMVQFLVSEIESLLGQMGSVIAECMEPVVYDDMTNLNLSRCDNEYLEINELLSATLGIVRGTWKRKANLECIPVKLRSLFTTQHMHFVDTEDRNRPKKCITKRKTMHKKIKKEADIKAEETRVTKEIGCHPESDLSIIHSEENSSGIKVENEDEILNATTIKRRRKIKLRTTSKLKDKDANAKIIDFVRDIQNYDLNKTYTLVCIVCGTPVLNKEVMSKHKNYCNGMSQTRVNYEKLSNNEYQCRMSECLETENDKLTDNTKITFQKEEDVITHCYLSHYDNMARASVCQDCGIKFATPKHRLKHYARVHDKKYICSMCGKRFFREPLLVDHMVTHTGEKVNLKHYIAA